MKEQSPDTTTMLDALRRAVTDMLERKSRLGHYAVSWSTARFESRARIHQPFTDIQKRARCTVPGLKRKTTDAEQAPREGEPALGAHLTPSSSGLDPGPSDFDFPETEP